MIIGWGQAFAAMTSNRASIRRVGKDGWPILSGTGYAVRRVKGIRRIIAADVMTGEPLRDTDGVYIDIGRIPQYMLFGWKYEVIE